MTILNEQSNPKGNLAVSRGARIECAQVTSSPSHSQTVYQRDIWLILLQSAHLLCIHWKMYAGRQSKSNFHISLLTTGWTPTVYFTIETVIERHLHETKIHECLILGGSDVSRPSRLDDRSSCTIRSFVCYLSAADQIHKFLTKSSWWEGIH